MIKPGYRTSEFWFTLVSFLFSGAFLLGVINDNSQKEDLISETTKGLEALILIIGQLAVLFRYIKGRNEIKTTWRNTTNTEEKIETKKINKKPIRSPNKAKTKTKKEIK